MPSSIMISGRKEALAYVNKEEVSCTHACSAGFNYIYDPNKEFFYGFWATDHMERFIGVFNKKFKNIQIELVFKKRCENIFHLIGGYGGDFDNMEKNKLEFPVFLYLTHIQFNKEYSEAARWLMTIPLTQLARAYGPEYFSARYLRKIKRISLSNVLKAIYYGYTQKNNHYGYGVWCAIEVTDKQFLKLDDIGFMNFLGIKYDDPKDRFGFSYGTQLLKNVLGKWASFNKDRDKSTKDAKNEKPYVPQIYIEKENLVQFDAIDNEMDEEYYEDEFFEDDIENEEEDKW